MSISTSTAGPTILLADNGSLEPAAVLNLREIAARLSRALGRPVDPVSVLHSSAIPSSQLGGRAAETIEPALQQRLQAGVSNFLVAPLFFGPSGAVTDYLPKRLGLLKANHPQLQVRIAPPLIDPADPKDQRMTVILGEHVRSALPPGGEPPAVILVDHGSPARDVTRVRDHLAIQLREKLGQTVRGVMAASMERRPGQEYSFNEPLLDRAFDQPGFDAGPVIVSLLFVSPGRHAGPGGDIAKICATAEQRHPRLKTIMTAPVGSHPGLIPILVDRINAGLTRPPL